MEFLPFVIDLIFIAILFFSIINGRREGFVKMALSLVAAVISWIIASEYSPSVAQWINDTFIHGNMVESLTDKISAVIDDGSQAVLNVLPDYIMRAAEAAGVSVEGLLSGMSASADPDMIAENICTSLESAFIVPAVRIVTFCIMFAILNAVFGIGIRVINTIFKLPVIKSFNKLFGGIAGAIKGVIAVAVVSVVFKATTFLVPGDGFSQAVNESLIQQFVWEIINSAL